MGRRPRIARSHHKRRRSFRDYFRAVGPGVVTGAADNDPAGIATYTMVGATTGYSLLWLMLLTVPMLTVVEEMSARVGVVRKQGLARVLKEEYGMAVAVFAVAILAACNLATIAADVSGVAAGIELVTGVSWRWFVVPVSALLAYLMVSKGYATISRLLFALTPVFALYVVDAFLARPDWATVIAHTFVPRFAIDAPTMTAAVALLGTTISPYLIFWQTTEEVEERKTVDRLPEEQFDVTLGMVLANVIFYFIIVAAGTLLFGTGLVIETARDAALALRPVAGSLAFALFSIGLVGSGIIATPVLAASTAYAVAEVVGAPEGLSREAHHARLFYGVIAGSILFASIGLLLDLNPVVMLYYSQILDGILMPVLIVLLIRVTNDPRLMGRHTNSCLARVVAWLTAGTMALFAISLLRSAL